MLFFFSFLPSFISSSVSPLFPPFLLSFLSLLFLSFLSLFLPLFLLVFSLPVFYCTFIGSVVFSSGSEARNADLIPEPGRSLGGRNANPLWYACQDNPKERRACQTGYSPWGCKELDTNEWLSASVVADFSGTQFELCRRLKKSKVANRKPQNLSQGCSLSPFSPTSSFHLPDPFYFSTFYN